MQDRITLSNAASSLCHLWASPQMMDRIGVERILLSYPEPLRAAMAALMAKHLNTHYPDPAVASFIDLLCALAGLEEEGD